MKQNNFDYKGYSEEELLNLSNDDIKQLVSAWRPWIVELYSYGLLIREYGFFPKWLPIYIYHMHGPGEVTMVHEHEINSGAYCMFVNNKNDEQKFINAGMSKCETMVHPFVFYRKKYNINQCINAKGTIVYPAHSILNTEELTDIDKYIEQLKELPEKYKPLAICMHWVDIKKGKHKKYMDAGFPVYTAGNGNDIRYAEKFYDILKHFKYATSNTYGSYIYYAVDMGLPFFLYGDEIEYDNKADPGLPIGKVKISFPKVLEISKMFSEITDTISPEQKKEIDAGLGIHDGISRLKMANILYSAYFKKTTFKKEIKRIILYIKYFFNHKKRNDTIRMLDYPL